MLSWFARKRLDAFEREHDYDASYLRELLDTSFSAMLRFHRATALGDYRHGLPAPCWHAVRIRTARREDCGPCVQLLVTMAERDGISPDVIRGALQGDVEGLPPDVCLSLEFTDAVLDRSAQADAIRPEIVTRFGKQGLVTLAFAALAARLYPTLKYALGHGHRCSIIQVGGTPVHTPQEAA